MSGRFLNIVKLAAPLALSLLVFFGRNHELIQTVELKTLDWRFRHFAEPSRRDPNIVLVAIDQASLDYFEKDAIYWPWPRSLYGALLAFCKAGGAKAVVFDILFTSPSPYGASEDQAFGQALKHSVPVVLPMEMSATPNPKRAQLPPAHFAVELDGDPGPAAVKKASVRLPVPTALSGASRVGDTAIGPDPDGVFRRVPLLSKMNGKYYPTLPAAVVLAVAGGRKIGVEPDALTVAGRKVPLTEGRMLVRLHGSALAPHLAKGLRTYDAYPIGNIIQSWNSIEERTKPLLDPSLFKGKIIFVAGTAPGLLDNRPSPISPVFPGAEIVAAAADNILNEDFLTPTPTAAALAMVLIAVLGGLAAARLGAGAQAAGAAAALSAAFLASAILCFLHGIWLDVTAPQLGLWLSFAATSAYGYAVEGRQKRYVQRAFSHYLSPDIVQEIMQDPGKLALGGERREVTVYFSDIENFTTISESLSPEKLTSLMNRYLGAMTETILDSGGTLDKYIGDAVMAFWGAPVPMEDHALRACKAALANQRKLDELRAQFVAEGLPVVRARIGVNSGPASIGNMGSALRFSYTAIGDNVNLASRLEGANKGYHTYVMISESTRQLAGDAIEARELDFIKVKGKNLPIRVYELLGLAGETEPEVLRRARRFEEALALYRRKEWDEAVSAFGALLRDTPVDGACELFMARCRHFKEEPPPAEWDGSYAMTEK